MKRLIAVLIGAAALVLVAVAVAATTHKVAATLTPGADVPRPKGAGHAKGSFVGSYVVTKTGAVLKATLTYSGLTGPALQAHIHTGKVGVSGNVIVPLCGPCTSGKTGTYTISKSVVKALESGNTYVNVHTAKNLAGEIRGQIKVTG